MSELNIVPMDKVSNTERVLKLAAMGTVLASTIVAPNAISLLAAFMPNQDKQKALRAIRYAKDTGWITFRETKKGIEVALTKKGRLKWQRIELTRPLGKQRWDKKWRLVIFDIPVGLKANAFAFRADLKSLGLQQLQRSIWVTPYPCQTQIALLRQLYQIKPCVRMLEAVAIENEQQLKNHFHLN